MIDAAFVLRVLLEYYRNWKIKNLKTLKVFFKQGIKKKSKKGGIFFPYFREIIEHYFPGIPDYEVASFYR